MNLNQQESLARYSQWSVSLGSNHLNGKYRNFHAIHGYKMTGEPLMKTHTFPIASLVKKKLERKKTRTKERMIRNPLSKQGKFEEYNCYFKRPQDSAICILNNKITLITITIEIRKEEGNQQWPGIEHSFNSP